MALIFQKSAAEALSRKLFAPAAADASDKAVDATSKTVARAFRKDTLDLAAAFPKTAVEKSIPEVFDKQGMRKNLAEAVRSFSDAHPKAPTAAAIDAFTSGRGHGEVADFVTPIVSYRPRNPALVPTPAEAAALKKEIQGQSREIMAALRTLPDADRKAFHNVYDLMDKRPDGQRALVQLLVDGKLSMGGAGNPKRNLAQALNDIATNKLDSGIEHRRSAFLAQLTQELSDPVAVSQHYKGTCAATSRGQILWSMKNPTDYTDFVKDLASPEGKAKLPNGKIVKRPADWDAGNDRSPNWQGLPGTGGGEGRTISSQLTEPVFMQVGYGTQYRYSNTFDAGLSFSKKTPNKMVMEGGLYSEQEARLLESLFPGNKYTVVYPSKDWVKESYASVSKTQWPGARVVASKDEMLSMLRGAAIDNPIPVGVDYELGGGHAILVTGVQDIQLPALTKGGKPRFESWVEYINPWGQREVQRADAFKTVMDGLSTNGAVKGVVGS